MGIIKNYPLILQDLRIPTETIIDTAVHIKKRVQTESQVTRKTAKDQREVVAEVEGVVLLQLINMFKHVQKSPAHIKVKDQPLLLLPSNNLAQNLRQQSQIVRPEKNLRKEKMLNQLKGQKLLPHLLLETWEPRN